MTTQTLLAKKGILARVWLAAHWDKKLTKAHVLGTDLEAIVANIRSRLDKMALRISAHLQIGLWRIYSRKQSYLIKELGNTCAKIKIEFRPGLVGVPDKTTVAQADSITLPEMFHDFETAIADLETVDIEEQCSMYRSRAEDITLAEHIPSTSNPLEDQFNCDDDEFGEMMDVELPRSQSPQTTLAEESHQSDLLTLPNGDDRDTTLPSSWLPDNQGRSYNDLGSPDIFDNEFGMDDGVNFDVLGLDDASVSTAAEKEQDEVAMEVDNPASHDETLCAEPDGFTLEPVEVAGSKKQSKRNRKLLVDNVTKLSENVKPSNTLTLKCFPPPTKKLLISLELTSCDQLFSRPTELFMAPKLAELITRNFVPSKSDNSYQESDNDIETVREADTTMNTSLATDSLPDFYESSVEEDATLMESTLDNTRDLSTSCDSLNRQEEDDETNAISELPDLEDLDSSTESGEDGEERCWSQQTHKVKKMIDRGLSRQDKIKFSSMTYGCSRKQAGARFFQCLLLASKGAIIVAQEEPYGEIIIEQNK